MQSILLKWACSGSRAWFALSQVVFLVYSNVKDFSNSPNTQLRMKGLSLV